MRKLSCQDLVFGVIFGVSSPDRNVPMLGFRHLFDSVCVLMKWSYSVNNEVGGIAFDVAKACLSLASLRR